MGPFKSATASEPARRDADVTPGPAPPAGTSGPGPAVSPPAGAAATTQPDPAAGDQPYASTDEAAAALAWAREPFQAILDTEPGRQMSGAGQPAVAVLQDSWQALPDSDLADVPQELAAACTAWADAVQALAGAGPEDHGDRFCALLDEAARRASHVASRMTATAIAGGFPGVQLPAGPGTPGGGLAAAEAGPAPADDEAGAAEQAARHDPAGAREARDAAGRIAEAISTAGRSPGAAGIQVTQAPGEPPLTYDLRVPDSVVRALELDSGAYGYAERLIGLALGIRGFVIVLRAGTGLDGTIVTLATGGRGPDESPVPGGSAPAPNASVASQDTGPGDHRDTAVAPIWLAARDAAQMAAEQGRTFHVYRAAAGGDLLRCVITSASPRAAAGYLSVTAAGEWAETWRGQAQPLDPVPLARLEPDYPITLTEARELARACRLEVHVSRAGGRVFVSLSEPGTTITHKVTGEVSPATPAVSFEYGTREVFAGRQVTTPGRAIAWLCTYRETADEWSAACDGDIFTAASGISGWPRRVAHLFPHLPAGPDHEQAVAEHLASAIQCARHGDMAAAEQHLRRAEAASPGLVLAPAREAAITDKIASDAAGYAWTGSPGRYIAEMMDAIPPEWDWIGRCIAGGPAAGRPAGASASYEDRAAAAKELARAAKAAYDQGCYGEALALLDDAELLNPLQAALYERARHDIAAAAGGPAPAAPPAASSGQAGQPAAPGTGAGQPGAGGSAETSTAGRDAAGTAGAAPGGPLDRAAQIAAAQAVSDRLRDPGYVPDGAAHEDLQAGLEAARAQIGPDAPATFLLERALELSTQRRARQQGTETARITAAIRATGVVGPQAHLETAATGPGTYKITMPHRTQDELQLTGDPAADYTETLISRQLGRPVQVLNVSRGPKWATVTIRVGDLSPGQPGQRPHDVPAAAEPGRTDLDPAAVPAAAREPGAPVGGIPPGTEEPRHVPPVADQEPRQASGTTGIAGAAPAAGTGMPAGQDPGPEATGVAPAPARPARGTLTARIRIDATRRNPVIAGTDYAQDPDELRQALRDNHFGWRKQRQCWEYNGPITGRGQAVTAIRETLARLDAEVGQAAAIREAGARASAAAFPLTSQQQEICTAAVAGEHLVVQALAGTGKTTTLTAVARAIGEARPDDVIVYTSFTKSVIQDARKGRFGPNVTPSTMHALARRALLQTDYAAKLENGPKGAARPDQWAEVLGITEQPTVDGVPVGPDYVAGLVMAAIRKFRDSDAAEPAARHLPPELTAQPGSRLARTVVDYARKAWADISDPGNAALCSTGRALQVSFDDYLKVWALSSPRIDANVIMFDEAQDVNDCMREVILAQSDHAQLIFVGDSQQSIYAFRGAQDALPHVIRRFPGARQLSLTRSWRFSEALAELANLYLQLLGSPLRLEGNPAATTVIGPVTELDAVVCRTNATAVAEAVTAISEGKRVAFASDRGEDLMAFARAARDLRAGRRAKHPDLAQFRDWDEVAELAFSDENYKHLQTFVRLIREHGPDGLIDILGGLVSEKDPHDLTIGTVHQAKGLEWDNVRIAGDFKGPEEDPATGEVKMPPAEDLRAMYVALTRARKNLDPGPLAWAWRYSTPPGAGAPEPSAGPAADPALLPGGGPARPGEVVVNLAAWAPPEAIPEGWLVVNAPRPVGGEMTWEGEFRHGLFYAAAPPGPLPRPEPGAPLNRRPRPRRRRTAQAPPRRRPARGLWAGTPAGAGRCARNGSCTPTAPR